MKINGVLIVIAFLFSLFVPRTIPVSSVSEEGTKYFVMLDVCHQSGSAGLANADVPFSCENTFVPGFAETADTYLSSQDISMPLELSCPEERPPSV